MLSNIIKDLYNKQDLTSNQATLAMNYIMDGKASEVQICSFLSGLYFKGETIDEISSCAKVIQDKCLKLNHNYDVLDIVGTGGDNLGTINISTIATFIIAATGIKVAKHGNRSISSKCGSADLLEALGVNINLTPSQSKYLLDNIDICFMFAPHYHASMKYAAKVRKEMKVRTIFNIIGPLANPANANHQLLGVYSQELVYPLACVLNNLKVKRALVVCSHDGLDEISTSAPTTICEVNNGKINSYLVYPEQFNIKRSNIKDLIGGNPQINATIALDILNGKSGPQRDIVALNAAFSIYLFKDNLTLMQCLDLAYEMIDSKRALNKLNEFIKYSNEVKV